MIKKRTLLTFLVLVLLIACSTRNKSQEEIQKDWLTFETPDYSIKYPRLWIVNQSGYQGTSFLIISKQTSIRDFYQENVALIEEDLQDTTIDLSAYVKRSIEELSDSIPHLEITENTQVERNNEHFQKLIYTTSEGMNKVTIEKYYFLKKPKAYILTFSAKSIELSRYQPIGEGIMDSFTFK